MQLEEVAATVNTTESIQNWCSVDTRTGRLTCVLEENYCFDGEMYADELPNPEGIEFRDDQRGKPIPHGQGWFLAETRGLLALVLIVTGSQPGEMGASISLLWSHR